MLLRAVDAAARAVRCVARYPRNTMRLLMRFAHATCRAAHA